MRALAKSRNQKSPKLAVQLARPGLSAYTSPGFVGPRAGSIREGERMRSETISQTLEVIVASSAGTCFGVEMAIALAEKEQKPILGPLVHNPFVVDDLASRGIPILERYEDLEKMSEGKIDEVVITAHGYPRELKQALEANGVTYHDATCPVLLKWVYGKISRFEAQGYHVILVGNPQHAEIIASRSYGSHIHVVYSEQDIDALPDDLGQTVALCQTTITREKFEQLVDYVRRTKYPEMRAVDTRCKPVKDQQSAVESLAQWVDLMIIIGGFNSSNTTNLTRLSRKFLSARTYHIDRPEGFQAQWLDGVSTVGVGAGTSTPKSQIQLLKQHIADLYPGPVVFRRESRDGDLLPDDADVSEEI